MAMAMPIRAALLVQCSKPALSQSMAYERRTSRRQWGGRTHSSMKHLASTPGIELSKTAPALSSRHEGRSNRGAAQSPYQVQNKTNQFISVHRKTCWANTTHDSCRKNYEVVQE